MTYQLGMKSKNKLIGVHPTLVKVVNRTIELTTQDFMVHDGVRTLEFQRKLVARGASKTLKSMHLPQADGFGHAVDLVPYIQGQPRWEWGPIYQVALAFDQAASELGVADKIVWGGVWDRTLASYGGSAASMEKAVQEYCKRHPGPDFIDGPHYQLKL